jgi:hypothetical protein
LLAEVEKRGRNWKQIVDEALHRRSANDAKNRLVNYSLGLVLEGLHYSIVWLIDDRYTLRTSANPIIQPYIGSQSYSG